jgi:hypothetical protein
VGGIKLFASSATEGGREKAMEIRTQTRVANKVSIDFSRRSRSGAGVAFARVAIRAIVLGALAVGATAAGAVAIGTLFIRRGRIKRLDTEELKVGRLHVTEFVVEQNDAKVHPKEVDELFTGCLRPRLRAR